MRRIFFLVLFILALSFQGVPAASGSSILFLSFPEENIEVNRFMDHFLEHRNLSYEDFSRRVMVSAAQSFREAAQRNNFTARGINDQVTLVASEFSDLKKTDKVNRLIVKDRPPFYRRLLRIFRQRTPSKYMAPVFSPDKTARIKSAMSSQESRYTIVFHKLEMIRTPCGGAQMRTHYSVLDHQGNVVLGKQHIFHTTLKMSMNSNVFYHLITTGFEDLFSVTFNMLS